jgi:hypothetical protein
METYEDAKERLKGRELDILIDNCSVYYSQWENTFPGVKMTDHEIDVIQKIVHGVWDRAKADIEARLYNAGIDVNQNKAMVNIIHTPTKDTPPYYDDFKSGNIKAVNVYRGSGGGGSLIYNGPIHTVTIGNSGCGSLKFGNETFYNEVNTGCSSLKTEPVKDNDIYLNATKDIASK